MQRQAGAAMGAGRRLTVSRTRRFPGAAWIVLAVALAAGGARAADNLRRCEDAAGHVTYSNEACPEGTSRERKVENRPAVEVPHDAAAEKAALNARAGINGIVPSGTAPDRAAPAGGADKESDTATTLSAASNMPSRICCRPRPGSAPRWNWACGACRKSTKASARHRRRPKAPRPTVLPLSAILRTGRATARPGAAGRL